MTIGINVCRSCICCELTVDPTTGRCEEGHEAPPSPLPYDNCGHDCYTKAGHTMQAGRCAHAPEESS